MKRGIGIINKEIIVDVNPYRTIVVLMENGRAREVQVERRSEKRLVGNIYRGVVRNILPGMSAAFIDIGEERNAILHFQDVRIDKTNVGGGKLEPVKEDDKLNNVLKTGQEIMVQIVKEPLGTKGAKASMDISLPGYTLVLLPMNGRIFVSKRFRDEAEKTRLKQLLKEHCQDGHGVIVRSEAECQDEKRIIAEHGVLVERWNQIEKEFRLSRAPKKVWQEETLASRAVRDLFRSDVDRLIVNDRNEFERIVSMCISKGNGMVDKIEYLESKESMFDLFKISKQLDEALSKKVWLKSGAYIIFDKTEALVSIDVNTGKNIGKINVRKTMLETNREAAFEIAHQIRLRNLGGIIIIDFIDMESKEDRDEIVSVLREAMEDDPMRPVIYGMTQLGLVEVARKRSGGSLEELFQSDCTCCRGTGKVLSDNTVAMKIRQRIIENLENGMDRFVISAFPSVIETLQSIVEEDIANGRLCDIRDIKWKLDKGRNPSDYEIKCF